MHVVDAPRARAVVRMHGNCAIRENGSTCYRKQYPPPPLHFSILAAARKLFRPFSAFSRFYGRHCSLAGESGTIGEASTHL